MSGRAPIRYVKLRRPQCKYMNAVNNINSCNAITEGFLMQNSTAVCAAADVRSTAHMRVS
jgi:hypothetical protein